MIIDKYSLLLKGKEFATPQAGKHYPPSIQLEPIHQTIKLKFDLERKLAEGSVSTIIKANVAKASNIEFHAVDLDIHDVKGVDSWNYDGNKIQLNWKKGFEKGEEKEITVDYTISEPIAGLYFSYPDEMYPERPIYVVADHESERARYWIPCIDHISVRCSIDFHLRARNDYTILANGKHIEEIQHEDGTKTSIWKQEFPCPAYLLTIAIGEFIKYEDRSVDAGRGEIPIAYFTTKPFKPEDLKRAFDRTPKMLEWMWKRFKTPLEWSKYYQISTAKHGGAMENISFVTWSDFAVLDEIKYKEYWWTLDAINVHEMAHSWFGDMIVCREFSHAWLKESWAVYIETLYYEDIYGENEAFYDLYLNATRYMRESDSRYARPIVTNKYDSSWDMYDAHLYPGGAWRIHMLRHVVGDDCFWDAVIDYVQTFVGKAVETVDFQRKLETHSGLSLEEFFEQWLYNPGYPKIKAKFEYDDKKKLCSLEIKQTQIDEEKNIGLFKFPLDVMWENEEGSFRRETFNIEEKEHTFFFESNKKPLQIRLDPDYKVLFSLDFNPGDKMLIRQLKNSNAIGKILASKELAKKGKKKNIEEIVNAFKNETFWGVKREYAKVLAKAPNYDAIVALTELLETENDPMVLSYLINNLTDLRHKIVFDAARKYLSRNDILYYATASALNVIGSQRTEEAYKFLINFEIKKDFKEIIQSNLFRAIGKTRTEEALEYLLSKVDYGLVPERTRENLVRGIIEATLWAEKGHKDKTIEKLCNLLILETDYFLIETLVRELSKLKDSSVIGSLEQSKVKLPYQDHPMIDRIIKIISKGKSPEEEAKKLRDDIDEMKKDMKKLLSRIEKLEIKTKTKEEKT